MQCPAGKIPWRRTNQGPMPLLVPGGALEHMARRYPDLWIEILPPEIPLSGRALMPADLDRAAKKAD